MSVPQSKRRGWFISLRWKLLVGFTLLFSVVFAGAYFWFYSFATDQALSRIQADLLDTLAGASRAVNGDVLASVAQDGQPNAMGKAWLAVAQAEEDETADAATLRAAAQENFGAPTPAGFSDDPRYQQLMNELQAVHNLEPRAWPYLFVQAPGERQITYIADLWARYDPSKATPFLFTKSSKRSYNGLNELTRRLDSNGQFSPYTDEWGQWVSAYMPVKNTRGETAGAIGVDFDAAYVFQVQTAIRNQIVVAFTVTYFTLFVLVFIVSNMLTRPIVLLTRAAERIGEGDYEQDLSGLSRSVAPDEITSMAQVFAIMVGKVYQREQTLRHQIEELKIEIDEAKRTKQVSEIVDSDFFQDLQARAKAMRQRARRPAADAAEPAAPETAPATPATPDQ